MKELKEVLAQTPGKSSGGKDLYSVRFEMNQDIGNLVRSIKVNKDDLTLKQAQAIVKRYRNRVGYYMTSLQVTRKSDNITRHFYPAYDFFDVKTDAEFSDEPV